MEQSKLQSMLNCLLAIASDNLLISDVCYILVHVLAVLYVWSVRGALTGFK